MKTLKLFVIYTLLVPILVLSCKEKVNKQDFWGTYTIDDIIPADSVSGFQIRQASDWKIVLHDSDNFHFYGTNKNIVGYWRVEYWDDKREAGKYSLLLQGGGLYTQVPFDGKTIYFNRSPEFLDSLFMQASFTKQTK